MAIDADRISNPEVEEFLLKKENLEQLEDLIIDLPYCSSHPEKPAPRYKNRLRRDELATEVSDVISRVDSFLGVEGVEAPRVRYYSPVECWAHDNGHFALNILSYVSASYIGLRGSLNLAEGIANNSIAAMVIGGVEIIGFGLFMAGTTKRVMMDMKEPRYLLSSSYDQKKKLIKLIKESEPDFLPTIAHEYDHHVQDSLLGLDYQDTSYFSEGHARGVQRHVSKEYAAERNNPLFMNEITKHTIGELSAVYYWLCNKHGEDRRFWDMLPKDTKIILGAVHLGDNNTPHRHAFGNTLFSLAEARNGDAIYKDTLQGNTDLLYG